MKNKLLNVAILFVMLFLAVEVASPQTITTAGLELVNTFQQLQIFSAGVQLNGANSGGVILAASDTSSNYTIKFPSSAPQPNQILAGGLSPGTLAWSTACGGFSASGDLSGNATSQNVIGINGIPIDLTSVPQNGYVLKYSSASGKLSFQPE